MPIVGADVVPISPRQRAPARVEVGVHFVRCRDPDVFRQKGVQGATSYDGPGCGNVCSRGLPSGVYPCVRASSADNGGGSVTQAAEGVLENPLDCASVGLPLPTGEAGTIVMEDELHRPLRHGAEVTRRSEWVQQISAVERPSSDQCLLLLRARLDRWHTLSPRHLHWMPHW